MEPSRTPDCPELDRLGRLLSEQKRARGTLSLRQFQGYLFAVACAPCDVPCGAILLEAFRDERSRFWRRVEAEKVLQPMLRLHNDIRRQAARPSVGVPASCALRADPMANLETGAPIGEWVVGFGYGYLWLKEVWDAFLPGELEAEMGVALNVLAFFGSKAVAEQQAATVWREPLEVAAAKVMARFPDALATYARIGRIARRRRDRARAAGLRFN